MGTEDNAYPWREYGIATSSILYSRSLQKSVAKNFQKREQDAAVLWVFQVHDSIVPFPPTPHPCLISPLTRRQRAAKLKGTGN